VWQLALLALSVVFIVVATTRLKLHPFLALLFAAFGYGLLTPGHTMVDVAKSVNEGFGGTIGSIGIVILAGSIIGTFLERSGGALTLAERTLRLVGERRIPAAMGLIGYVVSIPVFCDSGFVLLSPLNRALSRKAKTSLAAGAMALALGLYATHTMVPPTPGPVAGADALGADLGLVVLWGLPVAFVAAVAGWLFAVKVASKIHIADSELNDTEDHGAPWGTSESKPGITMALLPILVPIVLIVIRSVAGTAFEFPEGSAVAATIEFLGQPVVALLIGVLLAFLLPKRFDKGMLASDGWVGHANTSAAGIIIITGAGGSFGKVLQNSGIAEIIEQYASGQQLGIWLPFLLAAALKTAQGSSTVAIITTANIMAPLMVAFGLESDTARALVVVGIGAGSMVVSHAIDSYFWVVTQFSKMSVSQGYRLQTLGSLIEGVVAMVVVWLVSLAVL
jgi:GntP family gluconate:H+ symporter